MDEMIYSLHHFSPRNFAKFFIFLAIREGRMEERFDLQMCMHR